MHTILWLQNLKRSFGSPMCRWEDIIRMDLREEGWESVNLIHLAQDMVQ
jgi:hypothetical protein